MKNICIKELIVKFLQVKGKDIYETGGNKVMLRGVCIGGWLNMENFITGFPGTEQEHRRAIFNELGEARYNAFFKGFLDNFVTEDDFIFLKGLGATAVRIPFNYHHFETDEKPGEFDTKGFYYLDKAIEWAGKHGLYIILDLHAVPGWQNEGWHSDNPYGISLFWQHPHFRQRMRDLWVFIAGHYKNEPAVAGYNLLNEPNAPDISHLNTLYKEWTAAIRKIDAKHIIFIEGNVYSTTFDGLDEPFDEQTVYSSHNYSIATHKSRAYPGPVGNQYADKAWFEQGFLRQNKWILERNVPGWVGEFGAIYDNGALNPSCADLSRARALADQLDVINKNNHHWTIWTYKDVDIMGLVAPAKDSVYMKRIKPFLTIKSELGLDAWTCRNSGKLVADTNAIVDRLASYIPDYSLDLDKMKNRLAGVGVYALIAGALAPLFASGFQEMSVSEIEAMMAEAFRFGNCTKRTYLNEILAKACKA
jgi:endoglucanase